MSTPVRIRSQKRACRHREVDEVSVIALAQTQLVYLLADASCVFDNI